MLQASAPCTPKIRLTRPDSLRSLSLSLTHTHIGQGLYAHYYLKEQKIRTSQWHGDRDRPGFPRDWCCFHMLHTLDFRRIESQAPARGRGVRLRRGPRSDGRLARWGPTRHTEESGEARAGIVICARSLPCSPAWCSPTGTATTSITGQPAPCRCRPRSLGAAAAPRAGQHCGPRVQHRRRISCILSSADTCEGRRLRHPRRVSFRSSQQVAYRSGRCSPPALLSPRTSLRRCKARGQLVAVCWRRSRRGSK